MTIKNLFLTILGAFTLFTCDNDLNITADFELIPVVYALIDANTETNYIRVEKGFLDPEVGGTVLAQIPDSLYFGPEVSVRITNVRTGSAVTLERVNLVDEGFIREEGAFATQPNIAYKLNTADLGMDVNEILKLELIDQADRIITEAETMVIGEHTISGSQPANPIRFRADEDELSLGVRSDEQAAAIYDCRMLINYTEENIQTGTQESKVLIWEIETGLERERSNSSFRTLTVFRVQGQEFFQFLGGNIEENPSISRTFNSIDLRFDAGGQDLLDYINIGNANTGITSNQIIPSFTNLNNNAVGIFSSRTTVRNIDPYGLNTQSRDSLREGRFTAKLNFN